MIALRDGLPLVEFSDGRTMGFQHRWLTFSLARAAESAGYRQWWLANHVTESVAQFFEREYSENVVTVRRLELTVRSVLEVIGYADVAVCFHALPPPEHVSLRQLATKAGEGYELAFFGLLRRALREVIASPAVLVEFFDLHGCVKILRRTKVWRRDCSDLMAEIVHFIRGEVAASQRTSELNIQLK